MLQDRTGRVEATRCQIRFLSRVPPLTSQPAHSPTPGLRRLSEVGLRSAQLLFLPCLLATLTTSLRGLFSAPSRGLRGVEGAAGKTHSLQITRGPSGLQPSPVCGGTPLHSLRSHACTRIQMWAHVTQLPDPPSNQPEHRNNWFRQPTGGQPTYPTGSGEVALSPGQAGPYSHSGSSVTLEPPKCRPSPVWTLAGAPLSCCPSLKLWTKSLPPPWPGPLPLSLPRS